MGTRYALYFVPAAQSELYEFGSAVLGYDCYSGKAVDFPEEFQTDGAAWSALTQEPRRYGFHATLKAPFHLLASCTESHLVSAVHSFAGLGHVVPKIKPAIAVLGSFIAIKAAIPEPALDALAASCTTLFDAFRTPISPKERARRIAIGLNQSQIHNLDRWGYPYVLAEFRFHMTLTGSVPPSRRARMIDLLQNSFLRRCGGQPIAVDRLALVKQSEPDSAFRIVSHVTLQPRE